MTRTLQDIKEWFALLDLRDRLRIVGGYTCCSNPNPVMGDDIWGNACLKCANCGAEL